MKISARTIAQQLIELAHISLILFAVWFGGQLLIESGHTSVFWTVPLIFGILAVWVVVYGTVAFARLIFKDRREGREKFAEEIYGYLISNYARAVQHPTGTICGKYSGRPDYDICRLPPHVEGPCVYRPITYTGQVEGR